MEFKPTVTIGLCVKNEEVNIEGAVNSILGQDFPRELMELIVVDGCSRDRTVAIIKDALSKADIKYEILYESEGLGRARQIVVDNANGDYIVWVDGDLILPGDYMRRQVDFMERNPKVGIAIGKYGMCPGSLAASLENVAYVVDSLRWNGKEHPRLPGTEGAIYRVKAIRQAGGFDDRVEGAGEDIEAAYRTRTAGWLLHMTRAVFYEKCRETWKGLWDQYFWWGYGGHYLFHKDRHINPVYEMVPPAGFLAGLLRSSTAYKITHRKRVFLLPIHYTFKRIAWCFGFLKGHFDGYGHKNM